MNLLHLKYAIEVSKTSSITKAAENLYMGQPNLSRAIKELEEDLGIVIFKRTSKGITPTPQGEEFLSYARSILSQVDSIERMYKGERPSSRNFSISVPRASYIACAFTDFIKALGNSNEMEILYKETNTLRAIKNITETNYKLAIIRYRSSYDKHFKTMLTEKNLNHELICEFRYSILISKTNPLADEPFISMSDLEDQIEVTHGDPYVPALPASEVKRDELTPNVSKRIFIFERGSQFQLLSEIPGSFMWASPVPQKILDKYDLVMRDIPENLKHYRDILIYKNDYRLTDIDRMFIDELMKYKRNM